MADFFEAARAPPPTCAGAERGAELEREVSDAERQRVEPAIEERFGPYGGRFVPEVLIPALDELSAAWAEARADAAFRGELDALLRDFVGRPTPLYRAERLSERAGTPRLPEARGPRPHRRPQDQQRGRPGAARQADGQAAGDRRDRRRPARGGRGDRLRAARSGVRRLHGDRGHAPPGAERRADAAARRRGRAGRGGRADAEGGGQRRDPRLGDQRRARRTTSSARRSGRRRIRRLFATSSG